MSLNLSTDILNARLKSNAQFLVVLRGLVICCVFSGCASAPPPTPPTATIAPLPTLAPVVNTIQLPQQPQSLSACAACTPCAACPAAPATASAVAPVTLPPLDTDAAAANNVSEASRGRLERVGFNTLPNWGSDNPVAALTAFLQGCPVLKTQPAWQNVCALAAQMTGRSGAEITRFFETEFVPHQAINANNSDSGIVTGYYEPLLRGSRTRTAQFRYPLYGPPQDLISIDLSEVYPELKNRRLRGRLVGNKLVPYLDRGAIDTDSAPLKGLEIAWVDDPVEAFFLEIQGSGQIQLQDGSMLRVGYADQNGHPFKSLAGALIRKREIKIENASMQGIKLWAQRNPAKIRQYMNVNPSYVFFKELPPDLSGPIGTLGVPLTAERSIAVDQRIIPLGVPVYLSTTSPLSSAPLNRLMVAQDTGGAIYGAVRADFYFGFGDGAGNQAGRMKQQGRMWILLPRGYDPNAVTTASTAAMATAKGLKPIMPNISTSNPMPAQ